MRSFRIRTLLVLMLVLLLGLAPDAVAAQTEVQKLQAEIKSLQAEVEKAGEAYSDAYWALDATRVQIAAQDVEIAAAEARVAEVQSRFGERIAATYRSGGVDYFSVLLSSDSFDDMILRMEYLQRLNEQDSTIIAEVEAAQADLEIQRAQLATLEEQQAADAADLKKRANEIEAQLAAQQDEYDELQKKLAAARAAEQASGSNSSPGANGMVFPVAGPNYYSDTWGAARSGGRTHKGTDIMAREGVPVVAVLAGTVRTRQNSLGGNTIWLTAANGWAFYYAHLSSYAVTSGRVSAGQVIGYVGHTGNASASAPHLHFEIHPNGGAAVNPYPYLKQMQ